MTKAIMELTMPPLTIQMIPCGIVTHITQTPQTFLKISKRKNKSERPFTVSKFKLMACIGYHIMLKHTICKRMIHPFHLSVNITRTKGSAMADNINIIGNIKKADNLSIFR